MPFATSILHYIVPLSLFVFILNSVRRNFSLLGLFSLFVLLGKGAFLPAPNLSLLGSVIPINLTDISLILLLLSLRSIKSSYPTITSSNHNSIISFSILLIFFLTLTLLFTILKSPSMALHSFRTAINYLYLPFGIILWNAYFSRLSIKNLLSFLQTLTYITLPLAILYILSAKGIPIYSIDFYAEYRYNGVDVIRDFSTIPVFLLLSFFFTLNTNMNFFITSLLLAIFTGAAIATATRSFMLSALFSVVIFIIYTLVYAKSFTNLKSLFYRMLSFLFIIYILFSYGPASFGFSFDRLNVLYENQLSDNNVAFRIDQFGYIQNETQQNSGTLWGLGFLLETESNSLMKITRTGDLMWTSLLSHFGYIGTSLYALLFLSSIFILLKHTPSSSTLSLHVLSAQLIFAILFMSFAGTGFPVSGFIGSIPFALLSTLALRSTKAPTKHKVVIKHA